LGSGWATDAYLVDERLVARFPRNAELAEWLGRDEALLRYVATHVGSAVTVPEVRFRGGPGQHLPHGILVCALIPGIGADDAMAPVSDLFATDLGDALTCVVSVR
jgi:aminoglycoside phosphotransferase (APT) family kinase protein